MSWHKSADTIGDQKILYFAVCFPAAALEQGVLRHPHVSAAVREHINEAQAAGTTLTIKPEFHTTLQFFSPPRAAGDAPGLMSLLGQQVQVSVLYVASTPRIAAARIAFAHPPQVALACANACPHVTLAVGSTAQAVWSNEMLSVIEQKVAPSAPAGRVAEWRAARLVQFNNNDADAGLRPIALVGEVRAFVQGAQQKVSPRLLSPATSPTSNTPRTSPARFKDVENFEKKNSASTVPRRQSPGRGGGGGGGMLPGPSESPMRREETAEPISK